ncbi:hypothetical protein HMSP1_13 [Sinorhizobium phage HMSP1-Susan]|nr:hypothetical protein HMSP1_13 [Sinorhizobium phage HMSP1-Susan]
MTTRAERGKKLWQIMTDALNHKTYAELKAENAEMQRVLESVANYAWRGDILTDGERLSVIKHHPTIKRIWNGS